MTTTSAWSRGASRITRARTSGPRSRSKIAPATSRDSCSHAASGSRSPDTSTIAASGGSASCRTCITTPSTVANVARQLSWRCTTSSNAASIAAASRSPRRRSWIAVLYADPCGISCRRNHSACWPIDADTCRDPRGIRNITPSRARGVKGQRA